MRSVEGLEKSLEELREENQLFQMILDALPYDVWLIGSDGRYRFRNWSSLNRWGLRNGAQKNPSEMHDVLLADEETQARWKANNDLAMSGFSIDRETRYVVNNEAYYVREILVPHRTTNGVEAVIGMNIDFTDLKKTTLALEESKAELHQVLEFLPDPMFAIDTAGKIILWNRMMEELTGALSSEVVGKADRLYAQKMYGDRRLMLVDHVLDPTLPVENKDANYRRDGDNYYAEVFVSTNSGRRRLLAKASALKNAEGHVVGAVESLRDITESYENNLRLTELNEEIVNTQKEIILTFGDVVENRSKETAHHVRRVAEYAFILAKEAGLSETECAQIRIASPMHDIGKIAVPDSILHKPGSLTEEEMAVMRNHTIVGWEIFSRSSLPSMKTAATIARSHHERWDGQGYPDKISGLSIPLEARITAVADVFDALTHDRSYKTAWSIDETFAYLLEHAGKHFDRDLVKLFEKRKKDVLAVHHRF